MLSGNLAIYLNKFHLVNPNLFLIKKNFIDTRYSLNFTNLYLGSVLNVTNYLQIIQLHFNYYL